MFRVLKHPTYARLFSAQVIALLGTGLLTVALGLLAFDLAGAQAGAVLGTAYAIKMIAYVGLSPIAHAIVENIPRKAVLIGADLVRAFVALFLPFITEVWQIYALIFVLQSASATFTPAFQAVIPDILEDEKDYTNALSLSRLAYDIENILSPAIAGVLLAFMGFHWLFGGTVIGFLASAFLVSLTQLPMPKRSKSRPFTDRLTRGTKIYLATPRLRGLLALTFTAAAVSAFILVNTVVMVRADYGASEVHLAYALAAFGGGSMIAAFSLPRLLEIIPERKIMTLAAFVMAGLTIGHAINFLSNGLLPWFVFLVIWALNGALFSSITTPAGRLLKNSAHAEDRPAIFTAHFALSHACWLVTYPIAGWVGANFGLPIAMLVLGAMGLVSAVTALTVWPASEAKELSHTHPDLPSDHPHFRDHRSAGNQHRHVFVIDDEHKSWPTRG